MKYQPSFTHVSYLVNILESQKCALLLDVPESCFNNWPDDDPMSRNMSPF